MLEISARKVAQVALMARELERAEGELRAFIDRMGEDEQGDGAVFRESLQQQHLAAPLDKSNRPLALNTW